MKTLALKSFLLFSILAAANFWAAQVYSQQLSYFPSDESKLWIEGRSNVNEFECEANKYSGEATLFDEEEDNTAFVQDVQERLSLQVDIRVDGFECGKNKMNRDLQSALKSDNFPEITFLFDSAELLEMPKHPNDPFLVDVKGSLTVAGETRDIHFETRAYYLDVDKVRAIGNTTIRMSDFNVEPPTALLGLIKADDELTVKFDLIATEGGSGDQSP
jgi:polyisoprenoid-binding protein YceI